MCSCGCGCYITLYREGSNHELCCTGMFVKTPDDYLSAMLTEGKKEGRKEGRKEGGKTGEKKLIDRLIDR